MKASSTQPELFDFAPPGQDEEAVAARARMRGMIDRLATASTPPWRDQMGVILDDGAFHRAMRLVPAEEAQSLWAEFDAHMERLYAVWAEAEASRQSGCG